MTDRELLESLVAAVAQMQGSIEVIEGKLDENIEITKALRHQSEVQAAQLNAVSDKIDRMEGRLARIEGEVRDVRSDLRLIEAVTAKNWKDISELREVQQTAI